MTSKVSADYNQFLPAYAQAGYSLEEAAEALSVSYDAVRAACARRNIQFCKLGRKKTWRQVVEDMQPLDAVEFLLQVLEGNEREASEIWHHDFAELTERERRAFAHLIQSQKPVSRRALLESVWRERMARDNPPLEKDLRNVICTIRKKLGRDSIKTIWGRGYQIGDVQT